MLKCNFNDWGDVLGVATQCLSEQTTLRHKAKLEGDPFRNIQPVQFVMQECRQTTIKLFRFADYSGGGVEHSLQLICDRLRSFCIDSVALINPWRHESMQLLCMLFVHAQELLPILRQPTAECDEVGAASRNQLHRSSKHASQESDPTKRSPQVLVHDRWLSQYLSQIFLKVLKNQMSLESFGVWYPKGLESPWNSVVRNPRDHDVNFSYDARNVSLVTQ